MSSSEQTSYSGELLKFVGMLSAATGDLSQLTCPAFLLNGLSILEYSLHWNDHPAAFWAIATAATEEEQMIAVLKWFLSTLYGGYHSRCSGSQSERKPFNSVLGENLVCDWKDDKNAWTDAHMKVEQVSHHPPVTAFALRMPSKPAPNAPSLLLQGHCGQRTTFSSGTIRVVQSGRAQVTVKVPNKPDASYTIFPLPELSVAGLLVGKVFVEILGKTKITSSTGYTADIEFVPKGWFYGDYFGVKGGISNADGEEVHKLAGNWTKITTLQKDGQEPVQLLEASATPHPRIFKPIQEQGPLECHVLWGNVTAAINKGDYGVASKLKTEIEEEQRAIRKQRKVAGDKFHPVYFAFSPAAETDLAGATSQDANNHEHSDTPELGHWLLKE